MTCPSRSMKNSTNSITSRLPSVANASASTAPARGARKVSAR
jgi:hypothetical protein